VKLRKRDDDGAIADFTPAIELDPKAAQIAYRNRALARNLKGDADGAIADYDRAIELDPKNADAYNNRGNIKKSKGDLDGAIADFTSAIGRNSNLAVAYKSRGRSEGRFETRGGIGPGVKGRDRPHHGLGARRRMKVATATAPISPNSGSGSV